MVEKATRKRSLYIVTVSLLAFVVLFQVSGAIEPSRGSFIGHSITLADAKNVVMVDQIEGDVEAVALQGNYAYVGIDSRLVILDISVPAHPTIVGQTDDFSGRVYNLAVAGDYAYVVSNGDLYIVEVTDPSNPTVVNVFVEGKLVWDVAVEGDYAYVACTWNGFWVLDVSDPATPVRLGHCCGGEPQWNKDVTIAANYAYVIRTNFAPFPVGDLFVVDVTNTFTPTEVIAHYHTPGAAQEVAIECGHAFVADGYSGLSIFDVTDPVAPVQSDTYDTPGFARGVALAGGDLQGYTYAYIADDDRGLRVIDVSDPTAPDEVGFYDTPGRALDVAAVAEDYVYVADEQNGLLILHFLRHATYAWSVYLPLILQ